MGITSHFHSLGYFLQTSKTSPTATFSQRFSSQLPGSHRWLSPGPERLSWFRCPGGPTRPAQTPARHHTSKGRKEYSAVDPIQIILADRGSTAVQTLARVFAEFKWVGTPPLLRQPDTPSVVQISSRRPHEFRAAILGAMGSHLSLRSDTRSPGEIEYFVS